MHALNKPDFISKSVKKINAEDNKSEVIEQKIQQLNSTPSKCYAMSVWCAKTDGTENDYNDF